VKNIITTSLTQAKRDSFDDGLDALEESIEDNTVGLDEQERVKYGSINEQNKLLVNKTRDMHENTPNLSSPEVDWTEFESDYQARLFYETRAQRLMSLAYRMISTKILHDYDNYQDALTDYAYAQYKKGAGEPGYTEKVAELKQFFPKSGKSGKTGGGTDEESNA
jgi:hypothetical protein